MAKSVLVVEDNRDMREALASYLDAEGFSVTAVSSTEEGIDEVDENQFDVGLIDINLPGKSGFEMIEYIRDEGHAFPVLALTARDGIDDKLRGFKLGVNDYVVKPFNLQELSARIQAHLTHSGQVGAGEVRTNHYFIDPEKMLFKHNSNNVELTQLEFRMMHMFMRNNHSLIKLDDLIEDVWGEESDMLNPPVRIHVANLRKKIGDKDFRIIRTVPGTGYIFNDPLD